MSTEADLLRRAATLLRETAAAGCGGPWVAPGTIGDYGWSVIFPGLHGNGIETEDSPRGKADAEWIALVGPQVAEPLAAWFEAEARRVNRRHPSDGNPAVDLARVLLGETGETTP